MGFSSSREFSYSVVVMCRSSLDYLEKISQINNNHLVLLHTVYWSIEYLYIFGVFY